MNECQVKNKFTEILSGFRWFLLNCNRTASEGINLVSCVNEHLGYEFENGRAHGEGIIEDGKYIFNDGRCWLNLHKGCTLDLGRTYSGSPFDFYSGGEPLIEGYRRLKNYY